jgi:Emfourin
MMRYQFARTGGFAGMHLATTIDSDALPAQEAQALQQELAAARFFSLPNQIKEQGGGADRFQYEITVDDGKQQHSVVVSEGAVPDTLQPLVQHLERLARTRRS